MNSRHVSKITPFLLIIIILLTSFAVYFNALFNEFVYDDNLQILENGWIKNIRFIPEIFSKNAWGYREDLSNYYRPLMNIIFMFNYHIFGLKPWGFHLMNILFHACVSVLVFIIASILLRKSHPSALTPSPLFPFIAAMLFATHPIHTEAVTWISGIPELSFTFFYLLSLYFYIRAGEGLKSGYLYSVLSFSLAILCKETALTLLIILFLYDITFGSTNDRFRNYLKRYTSYYIVAGIYLIVRFLVLGGFAPIKRHAQLSFYQYAINVFPLFAKYLEKLLLPINLNAFHVFHPISSIFETKGMLSFGVTASFFILTFIALKKNKVAFFCLSLMTIPLLPVLYIPAVGDNTFAERYLYLPSVGFVILLALFLVSIKSKLRRGASILVVVFLLLGVYATVTVSRNRDWKDDYTLFTDTVKKSPDAAIPRNILGHILSEKGWLDEGMQQYRIALALNPNLVEAHNNLGNAYYKKGLLDYAIREYQIALFLNPNDRDALYNLSVVYNIREAIHSQERK